MKKQILLFVLTLLPMLASADNVKIDGIYYNLITKAKQAEVISNPNYYSGEVVIPSSVTYNDVEYSVTTIGEQAFSYCTSLTSVTIPNSVTSIGDGAFDHCTSLTSITIGNSVTSIGNSAFYFCRSLTSITIPNSVTSIGEAAFYYCFNLTSITIPNSVTSIGGGAFDYCTSLTSITIPNSVTSIGTFVFSRCSSLTSIVVERGNAVYDSRNNCNAIIETSTNTLIAGCKNTIIPNSVTSIGGYAFDGCSSLTSITIPNSVTSIGNSAFYGCRGLTSVTCLAENVPTTASNAFDNSNIGNATLIVPAESLTDYQAAAPWSGFGKFVGIDDSGSCGDNVTYIFVEDTGTLTIFGTGAMTDYTKSSSVPWYSYRSKIKTVDIGNGVTSIGDYAFSGCSGLTSVTIPNSVTRIGKCAFYACTSLTSITIPNSVTSIGQFAFYGCSGLTSITIPNSVTSIGDWAFFDCSSLTSITIPNSVTNIGNHAFEGCSSLTSITIPNSVTSIGEYAFYECSSLTSVTIPNSVTSIGDLAFRGCTSLTSITIPNSVTSIGGYAFYNCTSLTSITIPNSVTIIGYYAFCDCRSLTSITIPNSVTTIGGAAFSNCSNLTSIIVESGNKVYDSRGNCNAIVDTSTNTLIAGCKNSIIPNSVASIGYDAFRGCSSLASITIPNSVTSIGGWAFCGCTSLTSITIPNSVTSIGNSAFMECTSLTSITIPNSVTSIGKAAFSNCSGLTSVTCLAENVPTTESNAFDNSNIGNATLIVPAESLTDYQAAAPWSGFGKITDRTDVSGTDNVIYIEPFVTRPGRQEREVSIKMKNSAAIRGFQFDLVLPEGVTPSTEDDEMVCWLNGDRSPKKPSGQYYHTLEVSRQSDGSYRFLVGSTQDKTFSGNDGEIIMLKVNVAADMADGDYPVILKNIKLTESDISSYYETDVLLTKMMVLDYMIGDINGDNAVDVSDYIGVANHILGNTPAGFNTITADVNEDNAIDVSDYIGIANIILSGSIYGKSSAPALTRSARRADTDLSAYNNVIYLSPFNASANTQVTLSVKMKNTAAIRGFQFDLELPEGMTPVLEDDEMIYWLNADRSPKKGGGQYYHSLEVSRQSDGSYRFLCGSQQDKTFKGNDGEILVFQVNVAADMADGDYPILLKNMKLTETDISKFYTADLIETTVTIGDGASGIRTNVNDNDNVNDGWYTIDGRKLQGKPTQKGVYIMNGRKVVIK